MNNYSYRVHARVLFPLFAALALLVAFAGLRLPRVAAQTPFLKTYADLTGNGAAQALGSSSYSCSSLQLVALGTNTAYVRYGDSNVGASQGMPLAPGAADLEVYPYSITLSSLYFYAASGDKLSITCVR